MSTACSIQRFQLSCWSSFSVFRFLINVSCISSTGAINRAAVEKEATITYDEFVNELDTGDSFTTSLVDILVKVTSLYSTFIL